MNVARPFKTGIPLKSQRRYATGRRSREKYLGLGADGESETHRTADRRAAEALARFFHTSYATRRKVGAS